MKRIATFGVVALVALAGGADAQSARDVAALEPLPAATAVPFGPGEEAQYQVKLGLFGDVGEGRLTVGRLDTVRGEETYHLQMQLKGGDRKSTRLNSSHVKISYAVFCLKKI